MNPPNQEPWITTEEVFSIGGEGGSISISRQIRDEGVRFIYHHNEFDPFTDETLINDKSKFPTFEEAFQLIQRYKWYSLYLTVHEDYRDYIADKLVERLNADGAREYDLEYNQHRLEEFLGIKLNYRVDEQTNQGRWEYQKSD